jgi:hypothetical protein
MLATKTGNTTHIKERLIVAKRSLNATASEKFKPLPRDSQNILPSEGRVKVSSLTQLDGQYVILVS